MWPFDEATAGDGDGEVVFTLGERVSSPRRTSEGATGSCEEAGTAIPSSRPGGRGRALEACESADALAFGGKSGASNNLIFSAGAWAGAVRSSAAAPRGELHESTAKPRGKLHEDDSVGVGPRSSLVL